MTHRTYLGAAACALLMTAGDGVRAASAVAAAGEVAQGSSPGRRQPPIPSRSLVAQDLSVLQEPLKGYLMEEKDRSRSSPGRAAKITVPPWVTAGLTLPVIAYLLVRRRRHRRV